MDLFGQLVFTQLVEGVELLREDDVLKKATTGQLDSNDDLKRSKKSELT